ncbi:MAG TPA: hypothetical protein VNU93_02025 [Verrucomicrobiae bacterium]|nr:hypothetical protein [Verrucomicrobiae bacterium]
MRRFFLAIGILALSLILPGVGSIVFRAWQSEPVVNPSFSTLIPQTQAPAGEIKPDTGTDVPAAINPHGGKTYGQLTPSQLQEITQAKTILNAALNNYLQSLVAAGILHKEVETSLREKVIELINLEWLNQGSQQTAPLEQQITFLPH